MNTKWNRSAAILVVKLLMVAMNATLLASPSITNVTAQQRYPWDGKVDITYTTTDIAATAMEQGLITSLKVTATDGETSQIYTAMSLSGDTSLADGTHCIVWDMWAQGVASVSTNVSFAVSYETTPATYCVIDLSAGADASSYPVTYLAEPPSGGFNVDAYKTTKLVLKRMEAGTFKMQDSSNVTLTKSFFIGLFEVTQKQWSLVTGGIPSNFSGDKLPVENVSYDAIRGSKNGAKWPAFSAVDASSFLGKLRARTGLDFDLPTEAQWEYACRAGTTTTYSYGNSANGNYMWYTDNSSSQTHEVGTRLPNSWGLYDMHGNVWEWCLDWHGTLSYGTDPKGSSSGSHRVKRSGGWSNVASSCSSSRRSNDDPALKYNYLGLRLARTVMEARTLCVDGAVGNDSNNGLSWERAKKTIQNALNNASDGDTILVKPGVYKENSSGDGGLYNLHGIKVTIKSTDGPLHTTIDGERKRRVVKGTAAELEDVWANHSLLLDGFTLQHGFHNLPGAALFCNLRNCIIRDNIAGKSAIARCVKLENCLIVSNVVNNNEQSMNAVLLDHLEMINSTVSDNTLLNGAGCHALVDCAITNSIIFGNDVGSGSLFSDDAFISYSCLTTPAPAEGVGNIIANPLFADEGNSNYHLSPESPCINAGLSSCGNSIWDLDDNVRIKSRSIDMGCYEFQAPPSMPEISPAGGTIMIGTASIAISCATDGATVHYTTDGSEPTVESPVYRRFRISERTVVKAIAVWEGLVSDVAVAEFALGQCVDPVITPADETEFEHVGQSVAIAWQGADGVLRYTIDGSDPTVESPMYAGPFTIDDSTVVKAKVFGDQFFDSAIVTANLTRVWVNVAKPTITAASSFTGSETKIAISCATEGARIYYTLNGNDPNSHSTRYTGPFYVTDSCTVKAYATCYDYLDSAVATQSIEKVWGIGDTVGAPDHTFATGGDLPFVRVTDSTAPLGESMKSGAITHSQTSMLSTMVMGPGTISFQWKTSCEEDPDNWYEWDHAEFWVDGTCIAQLDGESGWQTFSHVIASKSSHTLEWRYVKDNMESEGEDCCWVAGFHWASDLTETQTTEVPVPYVWLREYLPHTPDEYDAYESTAKGLSANEVQKVWECYVAGVDPANAADAFRTVISIDADGDPVIGWKPDLNEGGTKHERIYRLFGRASLAEGDWNELRMENGEWKIEGCRFFKATVEMPTE